MSKRLLRILLLASLFLSPVTPNASAREEMVHSSPSSGPQHDLSIAASDSQSSAPAWNAEIAAVLASAVQVAAGDNHTCALTSGGGVKCWGCNRSGQLGDGTTGLAGSRRWTWSG